MEAIGRLPDSKTRKNPGTNGLEVHGGSGKADLELRGGEGG